MISNKWSLHLICSILFFFSYLDECNAQILNDFGFSLWKNVNVFSDNIKLANPWVGGINNIQAGKIDINDDGHEDLILFDKHGNKILPFLYQANNISPYLYSPEYRSYFPPIQNLFQLNDYNGDSKPDIFTYVTGGIMVYRNTSTSTPSFEKAVNQFVKSLQGAVYTNLLVTSVDYPAIKDIDNDGDLDIFTFWGLGSFIEYHKNMSVETFGNADSLLYHKMDYCWGRFSENIESNKIVFDTCINRINRSDERHTGSTLLLTDVNNDEIIDLVLGDVDFSNVLALINNGTSINALMTHQIDSFPAGQPVNISSFPLVQEIDIYNDGINNLLASPFDPSLIKSQGSNSLWLYDKQPDGNYDLVTRSFLQNEMIDVGLGSYPVFADLNNDKLIDLIISNFGHLDTSYYNENLQLQTRYISSISFFKNTGTLNDPQFTLVEKNLADASKLGLTGLYPAFYDIDNDGDLDMLVGSSSNKLQLFTCIGIESDTPKYEPPVEVPITSNSTYLTPTFVDIEEDGKIDLVVGNKEGKLSYYKNNGSISSPSFNLVTHNFGNVNVTDILHSYTGYSVPVFFRSNNRLRLLVGSESGNIFYYPSISLSENANFIAKEDIFKIMKEGIRSSVAIANINNDEFLDLVLGNYSGGVVLLKGEEAGPAGIDESNLSQNKSLILSPNPSKDIVNVRLPFRSNWEIKVYDILGNSIKYIPVVNVDAVNINLNNMRSGLYIIVASQKVDKISSYYGKLIITR